MVSVLRGKVQSLACSRTSICIWWRMNEWNQARRPLGICRPDWDGSLSRIHHHPTFSTSRMWSVPGKITYVKGLWSTDGKHYCCFAFVFLFLFKGSCSLPLRPGCPPECRILQGWDCVTSLLRPWYPGQEEVTQEILDFLSLEVRTEEGKQMMTTEKQPLGRAEGSIELWGWVAEKPHWGNADFEATSLTPGLE